MAAAAAAAAARHHHRRFFSILSPDGATLTAAQKSRAALSLLKSETNPERILAICRDAALTPDSPLDRISFSVSVTKLAAAGNFDSIRSLLDDLIATRPDLRTERFLSKSIILYGRAAMLDHAVRAFRSMDELAVPRSVKSLNALLYACVLAKQPSEVLRIFREYPKLYNLVPDSESYNTVIKSMCESGSSSSVFAILHEMEKKGLRPNATSYTTLLAGFYQEERFEEVGRVLELMKEKDCKIGIATYNMRIQSLCKLKRSREAKALLQAVLERKMKPNVDTYYHLIYGFCREGNLEEAKSLLKEMGRLGLAPNSHCYFCLIAYLVQGGDFDEALKLCRESMEKDWVPPFSTMKALVNGLAGMTRGEEAREIVGKMKEKFSNASELWQQVEDELPK